MSEARDRWALSGFGDEIASDLEDQVAVLRELDVTRLELRSAWNVNVVELDAGALDRAAALLSGAGIGVSAIASPVGKTSIVRHPEGRLRARVAVKPVTPGEGEAQIQRPPTAEANAPIVARAGAAAETAAALGYPNSCPIRELPMVV